MTNDEPGAALDWETIAGSEWSEPPETEWQPSDPLMAHPITHWHLLPDGRESRDFEALGTAFFISHVGFFLTARHVVETASPDKPFHVLRFRELEGGEITYDRLPLRTEPDGSLALSLHPTVDAAIGFVRVGAALPVHRYAISPRRLADGTRVITYGFSGTHVREAVKPDGTKVVAVDFRPRIYEGDVLEHQQSWPGARGRGSPVYVHSALTEGGISGGPLIDPTTSTVHALNCGSLAGSAEPCSWSVDVAALLDWRPPLLRGRALRDLADGARPLIHLIE